MLTPYDWGFVWENPEDGYRHEDDDDEEEEDDDEEEDDVEDEDEDEDEDDIEDDEDEDEDEDDVYKKKSPLVMVDVNKKLMANAQTHWQALSAEMMCGCMLYKP